MANTAHDPTAHIAIRPDDGESTAERPGQRALPQFATAVRGYDRAQVDEYITRLHDWLADTEERARVSEIELADLGQQAETLGRQLVSMERQSGLPTPQSVTTYSTRMKEVMLQAVSAAQSFRDEAHAEGDTIRQAAQEEGGAILEQAHDEAAQLLRAAQIEHRNLRGEITELLATRERVVSELKELQDQLSKLLHRPDSLSGVEVPRPLVDEEPRPLDPPEEDPGGTRQTGEVALGEPQLFDQEA
jgi:cell division septum initiation protein DivIVA